MKRFIEPILLLTIEVLCLIFLNFDKSMIYLLGALTFAYFFIRRAIGQNQAVVNMRAHKIATGSFRGNPMDTHTLQKNMAFERNLSNNHIEHFNVKWVHLILCILNAIAVALVLLDILPY
ncbi:hypothetical protein EZV73_16370 [Acidaminobacter sp. JC074]|uniref:hypothetical protein n=1 Tax=Acidaminobacter sp. JC074 TaxID=2530199 RepID=UPI001F0D516A|nr:hypothetical protein [Acidaminobacter sp. JC074]MCH4889172.1 hypothetical protein [Acidaminobacter sp. JC074]